MPTKKQAKPPQTHGSYDAGQGQRLRLDTTNLDRLFESFDAQVSPDDQEASFDAIEHLFKPRYLQR